MIMIWYNDDNDDDDNDDDNGNDNIFIDLYSTEPKCSSVLYMKYKKNIQINKAYSLCTLCKFMQLYTCETTLE